MTVVTSTPTDVVEAIDRAHTLAYLINDLLFEVTDCETLDPELDEMLMSVKDDVLVMADTLDSVIRPFRRYASMKRAREAEGNFEPIEKPKGWLWRNYGTTLNPGCTTIADAFFPWSPS